MVESCLVMTTKKATVGLTVALGFVIVTMSSGALDGSQTPEPNPATTQGGATDGAPLPAKELQSLVAPIALYPDKLVAQVLTAATFPDQVALASNWVLQHKDLTGSALVQAVNKETWNASVKALTSFPSILDDMSKNLAWTSSLGEAYHNQAAAVMQAVQALRAQAKSAGNLKSSSQMKIVEPSPELIEIQPANPQIVYVPVYNPTVVYGVPYVVPNYTAGDVAVAAAIGFTAGIAMGALMTAPWGWGVWGCDWHGGVVVYNHTAFYGNAAWHGAYYHGGYHGGYGYANTYNRAAYDRTSDVNRSVTRTTSMSSSTLAHSGSSFHDDGWSSRAASSRGWGSMRAGGYSGGRFAGGGSGGGGFHRR
jgi:uncharacterized membrane protein YgcG